MFAVDHNLSSAIILASPDAIYLLTPILYSLRFGRYSTVAVVELSNAAVRGVGV